MAEITTYFSQSAGKHLVIKEMPYPQLLNTVNAVARRFQDGETANLLSALRAELARRPVPDPNAAQPTPLQPPTRGAPPRPPGAIADRAHQLPREAVMGDNAAPTDVKILETRLDEDHAKLISDAADLAMDAARLPAEVKTDEDIEAVNAWIVRAQNVGRTSEKSRKDEKDHFLVLGRVVDGFFNGISDTLKKRIAALEQRKVPFLQAKRAREEAERAANAERLRKAQAEAEQRQREEQAAAEAARQATAKAEADLKAARDQEAIDAATEATRKAAQDQQLATAAAAQAEKDVKAVTKAADREEKILAGDHRHVLGKVSAGGGSSSLQSVWRPEVVNRQRLMASLGPLAPYLGDTAIDAALARAAKADPRPAISGVDFVEDFASRTHASTRG